jgi:hypothetical protein
MAETKRAITNTFRLSMYQEILVQDEDGSLGAKWKRRCTILIT